ncbi:integrase core domain-containing protein, partial [uncultured Desulfovibrio sp.]|uniref:integrase core domain-containing protein n=1 Tax=uncultured Desulfovibrio sp. TaxID=167968 RepID=UPI00260F7170
QQNSNRFEEPPPFSKCAKLSLHYQINGIHERFHKTILHEFYQVAFRRKLYPSVEELQSDLDIWLKHYNTERTYQGKICRGRRSRQTLLEGKKLWNEKVGQLN